MVIITFQSLNSLYARLGGSRQNYVCKRFEVVDSKTTPANY